MTDRQRFLATMHYQSRDRSPICDFGFWDETVPEWHQQGLPKRVQWTSDAEVHTNEWFGMDAYEGGPNADVGLCPGFEWKVIEDRGDHEIVQQGDGVQVLRKKYMGSIPVHVGHLLVDRDSWNKHYKPRLDPSSPGRYPVNWDESVSIWKDPNREQPCTLYGGSLFGWLRDWMGIENLALVIYDDPAWFEEMVETLCDCICETLKRVLETGGQFDACGMWEDMCYNGGPLLSPKHFAQYLVPRYRRITDLLRSYNVGITWIDCDGKIDVLVPLWLDAGVNCMFPLEVGTWGADPIEFRRDYGRGLRLIGGFDKHILQKDVEAIRAEVRRLAPLVEEGGYIPLPDHRVPPDVPYLNYLAYLKEARDVWGHGTNLKPCPAFESY